VAIEQAAPRTPLWAVDASLGRLLTACGAWQLALPCPGAVTAETLRPQLWPGERAVVSARTLHASATRLAELVAKARRRTALMREHLGHLRSSARAPQVWILLAGFAPLGLDQMTSAFGVSRRGTYAIGDALVTAASRGARASRARFCWSPKRREGSDCRHPWTKHPRSPIPRSPSSTRRWARSTGCSPAVLAIPDAASRALGVYEK
jgi:hypothetical protein